MKEGEQWEIEIGGKRGWGGLCPGWTEGSWPYYGNANQASVMTDVNVIDQNVLTQGVVATDLTGGSQAGELGSNLIVAILNQAVSSNVTYACSADKVFKITATAVSNGTYPLAITGGTYQVATHLVFYYSNVYVFWNDTGTEGEIAKVSSNTIDPDWGSTTPATGAANIEDAPHYAIVGGDDVMYFTNGIYVGSYDGATDTLDPTAIDFWTDSQTVSLTWNNNHVLIAANRPNVSGSNSNQSAVYTWNGVSTSWEGDPVEVNGEIGALYTKNGITYIWWKDSTTTGGYSFGYISGLNVKPLERYSGSLPNQAQVGEYDGHVMWLSSGEIFLWGSKDPQFGAKMFKYGTAKYTSTVGGIGTPFGDILVASKNATTGYSLAKMGNYATTARWKSIAFKVSNANFISEVEKVMIEFETLATGAKCDTTLYYDKAASNVAGTQIAYSASDASTRRKVFDGSVQCEDFRLDVSWANGSATNDVKLRSIYIQGKYIKKN